MAYWWVYQGKSFERALRGGYLWAPRTKKTGGSPFYYWSNVQHVRVDDIIFSHRDGQIVAVSTPRGPAFDAPAPHAADIDEWAHTGWRLDVEYRVLAHPIPYAEAYAAVRGAPPEQGESPFASNGRPNQGFLFKLSDEAGARLSELIDGGNDEQLRSALTNPPQDGIHVPNTSALSIVEVRLGQSLFRRRLDRHWGERCAASGLAVRDLLRASHIKRWSESSHSERLDPYNGLLLSAAYDAAFDKGLITFGNDGGIILSPALSFDAARRAGIDPTVRIDRLENQHCPYLSHHRNTYFIVK